VSIKGKEVRRLQPCQAVVKLVTELVVINGNDVSEEQPFQVA
jgi:hypothetical protein